MPVQTQMQVRRGTASSWTSTNPTLAAGELGFETDTGKFKIGTGSSTWTGLAYATGLNAITYLYNATAAQTTFSGADANGLTLAYTVGTEQVFLNGALQVRGSDYTATNGTSIVLTSGALASDVLNVIAYGATTITDTYTQAQADAKFFQTANAFLAGKNKIINGDFNVWQRGTSFSVTSAVYTADRFRCSADTATTFSQQAFTAGSAPVSGYEGTFFLRAATGAGTSYVDFAQPIENVRTFAGQTVTLSFWAKANSATTLTPFIRQSFGSGGSADVDTSGSSWSLTTSWQRFTFTVAIPSISGKTIGTGSFLMPVLYCNSGAASKSIDIWGVQFEAGSIATPFQTATGTIQGELAACQRYYYENAPLIGTLNNTTLIARAAALHPVEMRATPTITVASGTTFIVGSTTLAPTGTIVSYATTRAFQADVTISVTGATVGGACVRFLEVGKTTASAEL